MKIKNFEIIGLFEKNYYINIKDNRIIIVSDNGAGKTTILRLLYFFLTKQWAKLIEYDFERIVAVINDKRYSFDRKSYEKTKINKIEYTILAKKYSNYSNFILNEFSKFNINELKSHTYKIDEIEQNFDVPKNLIISLIDSLEPKRFDDSVYDWTSNVIFLPTYRRIEKDYFSIYGDLDKRVSNYIINLFPEIQERISTEKNAGNNFSVTEEDLNKLFSNLINSRNTEKWVKSRTSNENLEMIEFGMSDVSFKIKEFYSDINIKKKHLLNQFVEVINKYLNNNKSLFFNEENCEMSIIIGDGGTKLSLNALSSGEKQLVSLFSHLFFDDVKPFIIIDEPEISLSISWQKMIIKDILSQCNGLIVATHSPFIVDITMREYTSGVNEFFKND